MLIGVPKEIKNHEYRVGLAPASIRELIAHGHSVMIQSGAGAGISVSDKDYEVVGATLISEAKEIFQKAEMIVKVKEPQPEECLMLHEGQIIFTYLHLAPDPAQARLLCDARCIAIAYETVTDDQGGLPLLAPMSEVAGRMSIQAGARSLEKSQGGRGVLLGGVPGVEAARVVVLGGGVVGTNAIRMAMGMEAQVTVLDRSLRRLKELDLQFGSKISTVYATSDAIERYVLQADLVIGAVLVPGAAAPKLVSKALLSRMQPGSVVVDVAIDQGGCFETSRPTTHTEPTYIVDGVVHYCVTNMPGAVPRTATFALNNATLPFVMELANKGYKAALLENPHLLNGLNVYCGQVTHQVVARDLERDYLAARDALLR